MNPQRNGHLICNVCRQDVSKDSGELIPHKESSTSLSPNETAPETARSVETPVAEVVQITSDDKQNNAESMASTLQILQSAEKETSAREFAGSVETPVAELVQITSDGKQNSAESMASTLQSAGKETSANESSHRQSSLPVFSPTLRDTEVEHISTQIGCYQALYNEAVEKALETIRSTLASMDAAHSSIMYATACDSERTFLSKAIQNLHSRIEQRFKCLSHAPDLCLEYCQTLAEMEAILSKERYALLHFKKALIDQEAAFYSMIKAADRKHETFDTVFRTFCEMEEAIKAKRLNK